MTQAKLILVIGVSGSGKSTVAQAIAKNLNIEYVEADGFHSLENRQLMEAGKALTDELRSAWVDTLYQHLDKILSEGKSCALAFSGLRKAHRDKLKSLPCETRILYLHGAKKTIRRRMQKRKNHFMPVSLLESQFDDMQSPNLADSDTYMIDINAKLDIVIQTAIEQSQTFISS